MAIIFNCLSGICFRIATHVDYIGKGSVKHEQLETVKRVLSIIGTENVDIAEHIRLDITPKVSGDDTIYDIGYAVDVLYMLDRIHGVFPAATAILTGATDVDDIERAIKCGIKKGIYRYIVNIDHKRENSYGAHIFSAGNIADTAYILERLWYEDTFDIVPQGISLSKEAQRALKLALCGGHSILLANGNKELYKTTVLFMRYLLPALSKWEALSYSKVNNGDVSYIRGCECVNSSFNLTDAMKRAYRGIVYIDEIESISGDESVLLKNALREGTTVNDCNISLRVDCIFVCSLSMGMYTLQLSQRSVIRDLGIMLDLSMNKAYSVDVSSLAREIYDCRMLQMRRYEGYDTCVNAGADRGLLQRNCSMCCDKNARSYIRAVTHDLHLKDDELLRLLSIARTVADTYLSETVLKEHVEEAVTYSCIGGRNSRWNIQRN